jgi:hypothetical protein
MSQRILAHACNPTSPFSRYWFEHPATSLSADKFRKKNLTLEHPIFSRWPAQHPDRLQLFSLPTPNGVKVSIMLEETGLDYEPHLIDIGADESHDSAFLALNPNGKIPAIYDPNGPSGTPLALFESGAILLYLADKTGRLSRRIRTPATKRSSG